MYTLEGVSSSVNFITAYEESHSLIRSVILLMFILWHHKTS